MASKAKTFHSRFEAAPVTVWSFRDRFVISNDRESIGIDAEQAACIAVEMLKFSVGHLENFFEHSEIADWVNRNKVPTTPVDLMILIHDLHNNRAHPNQVEGGVA